jgi:hypothetical protein
MRFGFAYYVPQEEFNAYNSWNVHHHVHLELDANMSWAAMVGIARAFKIIEWASLPKGVLNEGGIVPRLVAVKAETRRVSTSSSQITKT